MLKPVAFGAFLALLASSASSGELHRWRCVEKGQKYIFEVDMRESVGSTRVQVGGKWYPDTADEMMHTVMGDYRAIVDLPKRRKVEFYFNGFYDSQSGRCVPVNKAARDLAMCYKDQDRKGCHEILFPPTKPPQTNN